MGISDRLAGVDRFQQRHPALAIPVAVVRKFSDDGAGNQAALIAYYAFFSLFPLLLVFVTVLGFVLQGDPETQRDVVHSTLQQFPIVGDSLKTGSLGGSTPALVIGIVGSLLTGLGVTVAAQNAFNAVYAVPYRRRADFFMTRLRGLGLLVVFGTLQLVSTVASGLVAGGLGGTGLLIAGLVLSLVLNLVLFFAVFRLLTVASVPTAELRIGIGVAAVAWTAVQAVGGVYISHVVKGADRTYGTFATVIGLLVWLYLGARIVVYAAELNTVLSRRLWPRSLFGDPVPADDRARTALAKVEEREDRQRIEVTFDPPAKDPPD